MVILSFYYIKHWSALILNMQTRYGHLIKKWHWTNKKNTKESYQTCHFIQKLPCKERLLRLNLHTLKYRRLHGDMIEVFKIVHNVYNNRVAPSLSYYNTSVTRGNKFKLQNQRFNHNFRKFFFSARTVNIWNSLPNYVVVVQSIDVFKVRLDSYVWLDCRLEWNRRQIRVHSWKLLD